MNIVKRYIRCVLIMLVEKVYMYINLKEVKKQTNQNNENNFILI